MPIKPNTALRLSSSDKDLLKKLAKYLERNQSDTIRILIRGASQLLDKQEKKRVKVDAAKTLPSLQVNENER